MTDIQKIKRSRLPESFLFDMIGGMTIRKQDKYTSSIFYEYKGIIIFEYYTADQTLWVSNKYIWEILQFKHGLSHHAIIDIMKKTIGDKIIYISCLPINSYLCKIWEDIH